MRSRVSSRAALAMMMALSPAMPDLSHEIEPKLDHWAIVQRIRRGAIYRFNGARNARRNKCERKSEPLKHRRTRAECPVCLWGPCGKPGVPATKVR